MVADERSDNIEIVSRAVCLGRSPGFRPKDVNAAFWLATRSDDILGS